MPALAEAEADARFVDLPAGDAGAVVRWRIWGEGPPMALFHGAFGSWRHWIRVLPLAARFTLLVPDLPGFGGSTLAGDLSPEDYAQALLDGLLKLSPPSEAPLTVGGFSFGARSATRIAAAWPGPVSRLVLLGPGGAPFPPPALPAVERGLTRLPKAERLAAHRRNLAALMFGDPAAIDPLAVAIQDANTRESRHRPLYKDAPLAELIPTLACPVVGLWGDRDVFAAGSVAERAAWLRRTARDGRAEILPGAGHWLAYERPDAVMEALAADCGA